MGLPFLVWCLLATIWGSTWLFIKVGVEHLPPFGFAGTRFLLASAPLWLLLRGSGRRLPAKTRDWIVVAGTGLVVISLQYGLIFWAEIYIPSGLTAIIYCVMPLCGMVFAHFLVPGEPMRPVKLLGVVLGIVGVAIVFGDQLRLESREAFWACAAVLLAATATSLAVVLIKVQARHIDSLALTVGQMSVGCVPLLALGIWREGSPLDYPWTPSGWLALVYLAMVGSALAFVLLYWLIKRMDVTRTQLIPLGSTLVAVVLGRVVLGEKLPPSALAGAASILAGLLITRRGFARRP